MTLSPLNLLVVDDESFILKMIVRILGKLGYNTVTTASDGNEALAQVDDSTNVIISDLNMPEMDGVALLGHLAERRFGGGIILLSGEDERILHTAMGLARTQQLTVLGTLSKPVKPQPLAELLATYRPAAPQKQQPRAPQAPISEAELREGLHGESLALVYQPKIRVSDGSIYGVETLARWNHQERGVLGPAAFIPLAENSGCIHELTLAIYRKAIEQFRVWTNGGMDLKLSINVSVNSFTVDHFADTLLAIPESSGVDLSRIIIEVTESQVMADVVNCLATLMQFRMKRIGLSIDDFGTGNASLEQLQRIPFTELKIDRSFVAGAFRDSSTRAILESSIDLARRLKMATVAEGVETREDWDLIEALGVDQVQGFYCAKPLTPAQFEGFYENYRGPHSSD